MSKVCKFYLQGNCHYGQSCRFSHSNNRQNYYGNQYHDDYAEKSYNNANRQFYEESSDFDNKSYRNYDHYERNNHHSSKYNYNSKPDYNNKNNVKERDNYYDEEYDNYENRDYHKSKKEYTVKKYDYNTEDRNQKSNQNYNRKNYSDNTWSKNINNQEYDIQNHDVQSNSNGYKDSVYGFKKKQNYEQSYGKKSEKDELLKFYENEIKIYQKHLKELLMSNIWPFTCFHPIGHEFAIQPVGQLNFLDVSFEEARCDYYITKTICANHKLIHKRVFDDLVLKAKAQKEDILSFDDSMIQDDMLATFQKCEQSRNDPMFENLIQLDKNSYWNMTLNYLDIPNTKNTLESFSFVIDDEKPVIKKAVKPLKIFMQTEVYGNDQGCKAYDDEKFTDYIPIIPPPRKNCI